MWDISGIISQGIRWRKSHGQDDEQGYQVLRTLPRKKPREPHF